MIIISIRSSRLESAWPIPVWSKWPNLFRYQFFEKEVNQVKSGHTSAAGLIFKIKDSTTLQNKYGPWCKQTLTSVFSGIFIFQIFRHFLARNFSSAMFKNIIKKISMRWLIICSRLPFGLKKTIFLIEVNYLPTKFEFKSVLWLAKSTLIFHF